MKSQLLRAHVTSVGCCLIVGLVALFHLPVLLVAQSNTVTPPPDWNVGDVFVGVSGGSYQVWHSGNPTSGSPIYKLVNTISDSLTGATNGCGFDLAYRFFGTNSAKNLVDRYAIDNEHPLAQQFPAANNAGSGANSVQSVAFDGRANVFVAYSGAQSGFGTIERWTKDTNPAHATFGLYTLTGTFSVPVDNTNGPGWIDLASDGVTVLYTSQGPNIRTVNTSTNATGTFASLSNGTILFALRILPSGNVLVAAQGNVLQVNSASVVVNKYQFGNDNNLQALSLDSSVPTRAWVGDASSNDFILFDYTTKTKIATFNTSAGSAGPLGGICVDGSFSAAEVAQQGPSQTIHQSVSAGSNTVTFPNLTGGTFNETFTGISKNQTIQVTVRDSIVDPSVALSDPVISSFNPGNPTQGSSLPGNMICDTGVTLTTFPGKCELFEVEASPNSSYSSASTQIEPATSSNLANTRLLRNLDEDITDNVDCCSGTRTTKCVYTVNEQVISGGFGDPTFQICSFTPTDGTTFSKSAGTSTITFKLGVAPTGQCGSNNNTPPGLQPLLMIVQLQTNGTAPVSIPVFIAGKSGGPPVMTLSGNTYQLQIKTTDIPAGFTYVASVVDLTANITSTAVHFTMAP
jgi:hypothetical protein